MSGAVTQKNKQNYINFSLVSRYFMSISPK